MLSASDNEWIIWEVRSGNVLKRFSPDGKFSSVNFSSDGTQVIAIDRYRNAELHLKAWNTESGLGLRNISLDSISPKCKNNGAYGVFCQTDKNTFVWWDTYSISTYNVKTGKFAVYQNLGADTRIFNKVIVSDDNLFATCPRFKNNNTSEEYSTIFYAPLTDVLSFSVLGEVGFIFWLPPINLMMPMKLNSGTAFLPLASWRHYKLSERIPVKQFWRVIISATSRIISGGLFPKFPGA